MILSIKPDYKPFINIQEEVSGGEVSGGEVSGAEVSDSFAIDFLSSDDESDPLSSSDKRDKNADGTFGNNYT